MSRLLLLLFCITFLEANAKFQTCSCDRCGTKEVVGLMFDDICYFVPIQFTFNITHSHTQFNDSFSLLTPPINKTSSIPLYQTLLFQLAAKAYILHNISFVRWPSQTKCQLFDILHNKTITECRIAHGIFVDQNSDVILNTDNSRFTPCSTKDHFESSSTKTCIYYAKNGDCKKNDNIFDISSIENYRSIERFIIHKLYAMPKLVLNMSMPNSVNTIAGREYVFLEENIKSNVSNMTCVVFNQDTKQIVQHHGHKCDTSLPTICEYLKITDNGKSEKNESYNLYISIVSPIIGTMIIVLIIVIICQRQKATNHVEESIY